MLSNFLAMGSRIVWPWQISKAKFSQSFSVSSQTTSPGGVTFKPDGTEVYVCGNENVYQYTLSVAWDISSATFTRTFDVSSEEDYPRGLFFKSDGTEMYICGSIGDEVNQYTLSSAWDISSASLTRHLGVSANTDHPEGLFFNSDGTEMYLTTRYANIVTRYTLSTGWNISTASYVSLLDISAKETGVEDVFMKTDGLELYITGTASDSVHQYTLSSAWDITTAVFSQSLDITQDSASQGLYVDSTGERLYIVGSGNDRIYQYQL